MRFTEVSRGYSFTFGTQCRDADFSYSGDVYPGTYQIAASRGSSVSTSNLPRPRT